MPKLTKTILTPAEAHTKWGADIYVDMGGDRQAMQEFGGGDRQVWKPTFGPGMEWTGYRLTKIDYAGSQRKGRRG